MISCLPSSEETAMNQIKRIEQAMTETQNILARAERYSPEFQDKKLIAFCRAHIAKLTAMLEAGRIIPDPRWA
jgi:transcription elongation GreA/GreB family factor